MLRLAQLRKRNQGNQQAQKHGPVPKLASESNTFGHGTTMEDLVIFDVGQKSSKEAGKPMKKLLAEEMSKETITKKKSPSVIAKLMGLDGQQSPKPAHRQQRRFLVNYAKKTASVGVEENGKQCHSKSSRNNSVGNYECKDVFEDPEASHVSDQHKSSKQNAKRKISRQELAFINRKCEELRRESAEIHNQVLRRDSDPELLQKSLQQSDSLFVKHMHNQQSLPSSSQCSHIAVLKPTNYVKCEANAKGWNTERQTSRNLGKGTCRRHDGELLEHSFGYGTHNSFGSSRILSEAKEETDIHPRRIVVLKPSLRQTGDATKYASSPDKFRNQDLAINIREAGSWIEKGVLDETGFSWRKYREARETAKEITRQMRDSFGPFGGLHINEANSRGYAGDGTSYNMSESDSETEKVITLTSRKSFDSHERHKLSVSSADVESVITLTSRNSFDCHDRHKLSVSSADVESSLSREAKKRLSDRWRLTNSYRLMGGAGKGSTLRDMLSTPDRQMRSDNLNGEKDLDGIPDGFVRPSEWDTPMGISSRDGWKDGYLRSRSRSGSVPPSFGSRRHKSSEHLEFLADENFLIHQRPINSSRSKAVKGHLSQREHLPPKSLRSNNKKLHAHKHRRAFTKTSTDTVPKIISSRKLIELNFDYEDPDEEQPLLSQAPEDITSATSMVDAMVKTEITMSSESSNEFLPLLSPCALGDGDSSALDQEASSSQEQSSEKPEGDSNSPPFHGPALDTCESSKEADHHSPVSVLEVASTEDASPGSSDCFERVSADLHELRMHLRQLKTESQENYVVPTCISIDKEAEEAVAYTEQEVVGSDCWDSSYIVDLLVESGFNVSDPDLFISNCYSSDSPLNPSVFDNLEKKYSEETTGLRSERKLLFDRINMSLLDIYRSVMDSCPWVKPVRIGVGLMWQILGVEDQLQKLLAIHEREANLELLDKKLDREMGWFESRDDIDAIGKEIEELLIGDLVIEVLNM